MRKILVALVLFVVLGGGTFLAMPSIAETKLRWDCSDNTVDQACLNRMRAMGHIRSGKGDLKQAQYWYAKAANRGDPIAMFHLARVHEEWAYKDVERQLRRAAASLIAAVHPNVSATTGSPAEGGDRYLAGNENFAVAKEWYRKSADLGFAPSMNNLGNIYFFGHGGLQDRARAFDLYVRAAKAGNPVATWNVSIAYNAGDGVSADPVEAEKWATWTPSADVTADLAEPTLARTRIFGVELPEKDRENLRATAKLGAPTSATLKQKAVKPNPNVPTFNKVAKELLNKQN